MAQQTVCQLRDDLAKFEDWVKRAKESKEEEKEQRKESGWHDLIEHLYSQKYPKIPFLSS